MWRLTGTASTRSPLGPRREGRLPDRSRAGSARRRGAVPARGRARERVAGLDRHLRRDGAHVRRARRLHGGFPSGVRARRGRPGPRSLHGVRPRGRQCRARAHERVGVVLRARARLHGDAQLHGRGDLHRVLGPHVEGGLRRGRAHQVPDQRAGGGPPEVAGRRVPGVLRRTGRPAHRPPDAQHRRRRHRAPGTGRPLPRHADDVLRRRRRAGRRDRRGLRRPQPLGYPRRSRRRGVSPADLHEADRRPTHCFLRADRAPRLSRVRRRELQGPLPGPRAGAGSRGNL